MGIHARRSAFAIRAALAFRSLSPVAVGVALAASGVVLFTGAVAEGKSSADSPYGYERTWNAILRLVRVDLAMKVLDKDDANGYLLFEYRASDGQKPTSGSFELIRSPRSDDVRVVVQLTQMPHANELVLLDHLTRKMRDEYGDPPEPRAPAPPDAGPDGNEENN
jgi:hypothetical protein